MSELLLEKNQKIEVDSSKVETVKLPTNEEFFKLFEKNEDKLKEELNEYNIANRCASQFYVR
ncbi:MAG: hypothetical protein ACYCX2_12100 [Christensenellales bacterium]